MSDGLEGERAWDETWLACTFDDRSACMRPALSIPVPTRPWPPEPARLSGSAPCDEVVAKEPVGPAGPDAPPPTAATGAVLRTRQEAVEPLAGGAAGAAAFELRTATPAPTACPGPLTSLPSSLPSLASSVSGSCHEAAALRLGALPDTNVLRSFSKAPQMSSSPPLLPTLSADALELALAFAAAAPADGGRLSPGLARPNAPAALLPAAVVAVAGLGREFSGKSSSDEDAEPAPSSSTSKGRFEAAELAWFCAPVLDVVLLPPPTF